MNVGWLDLSIIVCYFVGIVALGLWIASRKIHGGEDYFLAGRQMTWPFVGASLFSTNISSQQFVGQAGLAFAGGIAVGTFQMIGALCFALLALFFLDTYRGLKLHTSPEFFERRYNAGSRALVSLVNVVMIMLATVSAALYAGSVVTLTLLGKQPEGELMWIAVIVLGVITGGYTLLGGLRAVIYTDFVQNILLIVGGIVTLTVGIIKVGGFATLFDMTTMDGSNMWSLVHPIRHQFGWFSVLTGVVILGIHGHCTDQDYIQRALAARDTYHAKMGAIFAGFLKVLALFICAVPGIVAARLFADMGESLDQDQAYVKIMLETLPSGLLGLCLAGLLAAMMSSVDSGLCAASSLLTCDFITKGHKSLDQKRMLKLGRVTILALLVFAILWAPFITKFEGLFNYLMLVWALMAPPVVVCVLCGLFYDRASGKAAVATLVAGILFGIAGFMVLEKPAVIADTVAAVGGTPTAACTIRAEPADASVASARSDAGVVSTQIVSTESPSAYVGNHNGQACGYVIPFRLPDLTDGEHVVFANLQVDVARMQGEPKFSADLYGLGWRSESALETDGLSVQSDKPAAKATLLQDNLLTRSDKDAGVVGTSGSANAKLVDYLNAQYAAGAAANDYVLFQLRPDVDPLRSEGVNNWQILTSEGGGTERAPRLTCRTGFNIREHLHWYFLNKFNVGFVITLACMAVMVVVSQLGSQTEVDREKAAAIRKSRENPEDSMTPGQHRIYTATLIGLAVFWVAVLWFFSPLGIAK